MANALTRKMAEHGIGVREMCRITGISLTNIRRLREIDGPIMSGSVATWSAIADALGCTIDELVGEDVRGKDYRPGESRCGD